MGLLWLWGLFFCPKALYDSPLLPHRPAAPEGRNQLNLIQKFLRPTRVLQTREGGHPPRPLSPRGLSQTPHRFPATRTLKSAVLQQLQKFPVFHFFLPRTPIPIFSSSSDIPAKIPPSFLVFFLPPPQAVTDPQNHIHPRDTPPSRPPPPSPILRRVPPTPEQGQWGATSTGSSVPPPFFFLPPPSTAPAEPLPGGARCSPGGSAQPPPR